MIDVLNGQGGGGFFQHSDEGVLVVGGFAEVNGAFLDVVVLAGEIARGFGNEAGGIELLAGGIGEKNHPRGCVGDAAAEEPKGAFVVGEELDIGGFGVADFGQYIIGREEFSVGGGRGAAEGIGAEFEQGAIGGQGRASQRECGAAVGKFAAREILGGGNRAGGEAGSGEKNAEDPRRA